VPLSREAFEQDGVSRAEPPGGPIADHDLHLAFGEENGLLAARRIVPIAETATGRTHEGDSLREKLIKIGAKVVSHGRYVTFQMAEVAVPRQMFAEFLSLIARPQAPPAPACQRRCQMRQTTKAEVCLK
jgi:hypothetical protein